MGTKTHNNINKSQHGKDLAADQICLSILSWSQWQPSYKQKIWQVAGLQLSENTANRKTPAVTFRKQLLLGELWSCFQIIWSPSFYSDIDYFKVEAIRVSRQSSPKWTCQEIHPKVRQAMFRKWQKLSSCSSFQNSSCSFILFHIL